MMISSEGGKRMIRRPIWFKNPPFCQQNFFLPIKNEKELKNSYERIFKKTPLSESEEHYQWILKTLSPQKGKTLLDVACGGGHFLKEAEKIGVNTFGLDISESALAIAKKEAKNSKLLCANGEKLPFRDETFDYVSNLGSLEHFLYPDQGIREMARVLKKDGKCAILVPNSYFLMTIINVWRKGSTERKTVQEIDRWATRKEWEELLETNGLKVEKIFKYNYKTPNDPLPYRILRPFIPLNLSYCFLFLCRKKTNDEQIKK